MPSFCAVLDCNDKYGHGQSVAFHKFPKGKNKDLLEKWIEFTQRPKDWRPSKWMTICGLHFRDEDYRCGEQKKHLKRTAIPSVRTTQYSNATRHGTHKGSSNAVESEGESYSCELEDSVNKSLEVASNCRFCGFTSSTFISFAGNFEIFGVIQKCLPTLSIRQDDNMPKEICKNCLRRLKSFARFIDKVLETQTALQRQFREKGCTKPNERVLKIKQEPVIRVKQENSDDVSAFFPDEVDDGCCGEQDHDVSEMDQKFQFCDFPVLNDQDIINNCDIMEIINLSDPFIDITNCENTIAEEESPQAALETALPKQQHPTQQLQSAHELLQTHFLNEEHNYANLAEDFKEEWPIQNFYKTEKIEADDECYGSANLTVDSAGIEAFVQDIDSYFPEDGEDVAATLTVTTTVSKDEYERSNKPIVTSVSSLNEVTMLSIGQPATFADIKAQQTTSRKKPNIVVLNESIVQSSHALQLQECNICQSKFFGIDSLNHHYGVAHRTPVPPTNNDGQPMVIVPSSNISLWDKDASQSIQIQAPSYKMEDDICKETVENDPSSFNLMPKRSSKNEITILDMQQTFLQHQYHFPNQPQVQQSSALHHLQPIASAALSNQQLQQTHTHSMCPSDVVSQHVSDNSAQRKISSGSEYNVVDSQFLLPYYSHPADTSTKPNIVYAPFPIETQPSNNGHLEKGTSEFLELQKRHRNKMSQVKCRSLAPERREKTPRPNRNQFSCRLCGSEFHSIIQLLRHKQSTPSHRKRRKSARFSAFCAGCGKFFSRKTALANHIRYICQSLPLHWSKQQLQTLKCRHCRRITLTRWRLHRRHELRCQLRKKQGSRIGKTRKATNFRPRAKSNKRSSRHRNSKSKISRSPRKKSGLHVCEKCKKAYPSSSRLNQHRITHTNLRVHQCEICQRIFKRRNGLTQHIRGFHMKLKPFECPTCKHSYALKADMRRCKHSDLSRVKRKVS